MWPGRVVGVVVGGGLKLLIYWKTSRPDHLRILDVYERKMLHCYLEKYSMRV